MPHVEAYTVPVIELVTRLERGELLIDTDDQPREFDPAAVLALLTAMLDGWAGPITVVREPGRGHTVIDGATRLTLWRSIFTDPTADETRPDWARMLGVCGLTDGKGPWFSFTDDDGRREVAPWQLVRTLPFLCWQQQLRTSGATDADQLIDHAGRLAARLAHCPVPVIAMPPDADQRRVRDQANARIAVR